LFNGVNLIDTPFMPSAIERGNEPNFNDMEHCFFTKDIIANAKDIQIIVPTAEFGCQFIYDWRSAYTRKFVGGNTHSDTSTANQDTAVYSAKADRLSNFGGDVGIIGGLLCINRGTYFFDSIPLLLQKIGKFASAGYTVMVTPNDDTQRH
jgi:hypothetical protein